MFDIYEMCWFEFKCCCDFIVLVFEWFGFMVLVMLDGVFYVYVYCGGVVYLVVGDSVVFM